MAPAATTVSLRLLVDKNAAKVVFAETDKPFVDFLFRLLSLPLGTVIKLVNQSSMVGSLGNLYDSIHNISDTYLQPNVSKDELLNPQLPFRSFNLPLLIATDDEYDEDDEDDEGYVDDDDDDEYDEDDNDFDNNVDYDDDDDHDAETKKYYSCTGCPGYNQRRYIADDPKSICPGCKCCMSTEACYVAPVKEDSGRDEGGGGFVKGDMTYMVTDDLKVMPNSAISSITIINQFNIKDFGSLEVKDVHFGVNEGLKILKAALHTESVLTAVFLLK